MEYSKITFALSVCLFKLCSETTSAQYIFPNTNLSWWAKADEDALCALSKSKSLKFCGVKGVVDDNCNKVSEALNGSNPQCIDYCVCQFTKEGLTKWAISNSTMAGYDILRNCPNNLGACSPNKNTNTGGKLMMLIVLFFPNEETNKNTLPIMDLNIL